MSINLNTDIHLYFLVFSLRHCFFDKYINIDKHVTGHKWNIQFVFLWRSAQIAGIEVVCFFSPKKGKHGKSIYCALPLQVGGFINCVHPPQPQWPLSKGEIGAKVVWMCGGILKIDMFLTGSHVRLTDKAFIYTYMWWNMWRWHIHKVDSTISQYYFKTYGIPKVLLIPTVLLKTNGFWCFIFFHNRSGGPSCMTVIRPCEAEAVAFKHTRQLVGKTCHGMKIKMVGNICNRWFLSYRWWMQLEKHVE